MRQRIFRVLLTIVVVTLAIGPLLFDQDDFWDWARDNCKPDYKISKVAPCARFVGLAIAHGFGSNESGQGKAWKPEQFADMLKRFGDWLLYGNKQCPQMSDLPTSEGMEKWYDKLGMDFHHYKGLGENDYPTSMDDIRQDLGGKTPHFFMGKYGDATHICPTIPFNS